MMNRKSHLNQFRCLFALLFVTGALANLPGLTGCTQPTPPEPQEGVTDVAIQGIAFVPKDVTISVGESIRWTNLEPAPIAHTTTSGAPGDADAGSIWDSGTLNPGESFTRSFDEPETFIYFCDFHPAIPAMIGARVIVVGE